MAILTLWVLGVIGYIFLIVLIVVDAGYEDDITGRIWTRKEWKHLKRMEYTYH